MTLTAHTSRFWPASGCGNSTNTLQPNRNPSSAVQCIAVQCTLKTYTSRVSEHTWSKRGPVCVPGQGEPRYGEATALHLTCSIDSSQPMRRIRDIRLFLLLLLLVVFSQGRSYPRCRKHHSRMARNIFTKQCAAKATS